LASSDGEVKSDVESPEDNETNVKKRRYRKRFVKKMKIVPHQS